MARHALLIGVSEFADERLARLNAPSNDVLALRGILQDSSRGNFNSVELSLNEDFLAVRDRLSSFFHDRSPDDVLLLTIRGMAYWAAATGYFWRPKARTSTRRAPAVSRPRKFVTSSRTAVPNAQS